METVVFVYGTLKQGGENHALIHDAEYLGTARTKAPYALYLGRYPYLIKEEQRYHVNGEVYSVTLPMLSQLDGLEGHPHVYCREQAAVIMASDRTERQAWIYFYPQKHGELLPIGEFDVKIHKN